jgi:hypothetical protein
VLERTDHVLLVGPGALRFAVAHGFKEMDLLTDEARIVWLRWKERMSDDDAWGPGLATPEEPKQSKLYDGTPARAELIALADEYIAHPPTGTINCIAVNDRGDISGTTTTSGLFHKLAGRVGDSPLIGCGLFVDNEVGAAGSTGEMVPRTLQNSGDPATNVPSVPTASGDAPITSTDCTVAPLVGSPIAVGGMLNDFRLAQGVSTACAPAGSQNSASAGHSFL